jgi:phosphoesterase RecJ-like protein
MDVPVPSEILRFLTDHDSFAIVGHKEPDGDCIGSQLALASFLARKGKEVLLCSAGPFKRTEIKAWEGLFSASIPDSFKARKPACVIVDCSNVGRVGSLESDIGGLPLAFIDHHALGESSGQAIFIDPESPAVAFQVLELIEASGDAPTKEEAEFLFFGLCTDTGYFRHLDARSERIFRGASRLVAAGASPKEAFARMYGGKSMNSRLLLGRILNRLEAHFGGRLMYSYETLEDSQEFGIEGRDSDMLYQLIQSISGCEAIVIIRQESVENCTVGFRSRDAVDVGAVAASLGGGGHRQASGLFIAGKIPEVRDKILAAFEGALLPLK